MKSFKKFSGKQFIDGQKLFNENKIAVGCSVLSYANKNSKNVCLEGVVVSANLKEDEIIITCFSYDENNYNKDTGYHDLELVGEEDWEEWKGSFDEFRHSWLYLEKFNG